MALTIHDRCMTSDQTPHAARLAPGQERQWEVSWLPGRRVTHDEAITAMTLAEACSPAGTRRQDRMRPFIQGWAAELGLTPGQAATRIASLPAWAATAEPDPGRPDPGRPDPEQSDPEAGE
jgi:hypothetical protein